MFVAAGCSPIANRRGMTITYPSPQFRDTVLIFTCLPGFRLVGMSTLHCDGQQWSSDPPVCTEQPSTTASMLLQSSTAVTSTSDEGVVVPSRSPSSPLSLSIVPLTRELSPAPPVMSTDVVGDFATSTSRRRYLPASFSTPASFESTSARMLTPGGPVTAANTSVVSQHQGNTGATMTPLHTPAAETLPRVTYRITSRLVPTWRLSTLSDIDNVTFSQSRDAVSVTTDFVGFRPTAVTSPVKERATSEPVVVSSTHGSSDLQLQSRTTPHMMNDVLANDTGQLSSEDWRSGRTLIWYATVLGSCAILLAIGGAACGLVCRRSRAFRRYQLMDAEDEMQSVAAAASRAGSGSGRSTFYAMQYTQLTDSCLDDEQQSSLQRPRRPSSNDECSNV